MVHIQTSFQASKPERRHAYMKKAHDKFRDPVHGFIEVNALEREIINAEPFQRLRNIKQLAMTHLVFHGAHHTRF